MFRSIQEVKRANRRVGQTWFSPGDMDMFDTKIVSKLFTIDGGRQFFITLDQADDDEDRRYTVREVLADGIVQTLGRMRDHATQADATKAIEKVAR